MYARFDIEDAGDTGESDVASRGDAIKASGRAERSPRGIVWRPRADGTIEPVEVALGITDHAYTEVRQVLHGALKPGDDVVTTAVVSKTSASGPQAIRR